ncbi:tetrapyrrole biosynthesis, uroporphyrinogen III synthase [Xylariaceae sp. FL0662B]|nr:tetrapyrrole biosynthesis, uroporphyrinogen III synthase [Xylariaceae sp. FL0662B]
MLLLKTKSTPTDAYEDLFSNPRDGFDFEPTFVPVLQHRFEDDGMCQFQTRLQARQISNGPDATYGGLVFTSQRAVEAFAKLVDDGKGDSDKSWPHLQDIPIYSVGPATTRALRAVSQTPPLQIFGEHTGNGDALAQYILEHYGEWYRGRPKKPPLLFLVGEQRRDIIPKTLMDPNLPSDRRIEVTEVVVYGTGVMESFARDFQDVLNRTADRPSRWVVVFSPTGCHNMLRGLGMLDEESGKFLKESQGKRTTYIATIGPTTHLSPPSSGISTPVPNPPSHSRPTSPPHTQSPSQPPLRSPKPTSGTASPSGGTYGIGSAVMGLWRRLSTLETPTTAVSTTPFHLYHASTEPAALATTGTATGTGNGDGINGAFRPPGPPRRTASPRGLPSLEPLALRGYRGDTGADERLLARGLAEEIRTFLPERLKIVDQWRLVYSLYQDGSSLATLYKLCEEYRGRRVGFVLVVRDGKEGTFGAYLTEAPHPAPSYFGTGECFLWRASLHAPLPPPPSADTTDLNFRTTTIASPIADAFPENINNTPTTSTSGTSGASSASSAQQHHLAPSAPDPATNKLPGGPAVQSIRFQNFAYTGANDYCIFCETGFLSVGGGHGGTFGLWLDDELSRGHSAPCDTFLNQPLSEEGEKFDVLGVELWVVGAS